MVHTTFTRATFQRVLVQSPPRFEPKINSVNLTARRAIFECRRPCLEAPPRGTRLSRFPVGAVPAHVRPGEESRRRRRRRRRRPRVNCVAHRDHSRECRRIQRCGSTVGPEIGFFFSCAEFVLFFFLILRRRRETDRQSVCYVL